METDSSIPTTYDELLAENFDLKQQLAYLKRMVFGQKRERFVPSVPEELWFAKVNCGRSRAY